jgi:hypothetical protein
VGTTLKSINPAEVELDNVTHPSGVQIESELQICQPDEIKSTNDLIVTMQH